MKDTDFELIMVYADGEAGPEETSRAEALLAEQPQARAALARLRALDTQIKASLDSVLDEPVPERLTKAATAQALCKNRVLRFPMRWAPSHWALAASVTLAVGGAFFWMAGPEPGADSMQSFVYQTLEQTPSGARRSHPKRDWQVMPLASYQSADGRLCREYAERSVHDTRLGLACRSAEGEWQTLVSQQQVTGEVYLPASGPTSEVEQVLQRLAAGEPLSAEEEKARLNRLQSERR